MVTKNLILVLTATFWLQNLLAQQLPLFTQYREFAGIINPAYINSDYFLQEYNLSFGASYRSQWVGQPGTPRTMALRGEYVLGDRGSVGGVFGGYILHDQVGPTSSTGAYGRIGGILSSDPRDGGFCMALTVGAVQHRLDARAVNLIEPGDDLAFDQTRIIPDVGAGIFYYQRVGDNNFYVGASMPQVLGLNLTYKNGNDEYDLKRVRHYYANAGYYLYVNEESFIEPSVWLRFVPHAPVSLDANLRYRINDSFWVGTGVSTSKSFHLETGFLLGDNIGLDNTLKIGYGFDYFFTTFGPFFGGSHEINIAYLLER